MVSEQKIRKLFRYAFFSGKADRTSGRASCTLSNGDAVVDGSSPGASEFFLRLIIANLSQQACCAHFGVP